MRHYIIDAGGSPNSLNVECIKRNKKIYRWVIGAAYFIADPIVKKLTGKGIGEHFGDAVNTVTGTSKSLSEQFISGWSSFESYLRNLRPF